MAGALEQIEILRGALAAAEARLDDTVAALEERHDVVEAHVADLAAKVDNITRLLGGWLDQHAKQAVDSQVAFINARAPQRTQEPARQVQPAAFDGAVDRINNKRREVLKK